MSQPALTTYFAETVDTLKQLHENYGFNKNYALNDEMILVEFTQHDFETHEIKNLSLGEIIYDVLSGDNRIHNVSFNLHHVKISKLYAKEEKSVTRAKVLRSLHIKDVDSIFNMNFKGSDMEDNYKWNYMGEDNALHSNVDLAYLLVTLWPSGDLFKETANLTRDIANALEVWCPEFRHYKKDILSAAFK